MQSVIDNTQSTEFTRRELKLDFDQTIRNVQQQAMLVIDQNKPLFRKLWLFSSKINLLLVAVVIMSPYLLTKLNLPFFIKISILALPIIIITQILFYLTKFLYLYLIVNTIQNLPIEYHWPKLIQMGVSFWKKNLPTYLGLWLTIYASLLKEAVFFFLLTFIIFSLVATFLFGSNFLLLLVYPAIDLNRQYHLIRVLITIMALLIGFLRLFIARFFLPFVDYIYFENVLLSRGLNIQQILKENDDLFALIGLNLVVKYEFYHPIFLFDYRGSAFFYCLYLYLKSISHKATGQSQ